MTRTKKVAGSVALGLSSQVLAMIVGLWLTRFILLRLGQHDYGIWLLILQSLGYLALADIGVVAVLPRQTAFLTANDESRAKLPALVGETTRLVLWQTPVVMALAALAWLFFPDAWSASRTPLLLMMAAFAVAFPLRLFPAVLQGLQDIVFLGWIQMATWIINTITVVVALQAGLGMYALALAWTLTQIIPALACWVRLRTAHPGVLPARLPRLTWSAARTHLASATWVSIGQLSQAMVNGADVLIIGALLGPAAVVPYVVTLKLIGVVGGMPASLAHAAGPGLSQMRAGESRDNLRRATSALAQAVLAATGLVACVIVAVNHGFVAWWVGPDKYAGAALTLAGVALMLLRHYSTTVVFAIYSFGHEKRLALSGIAEGVATVASGIALVKAFGPVGAAVGALLSVALVTLPLTVPTLARETESTVGGVIRSMLPVALRIALAVAGGIAIAKWLAPQGPVMLIAATLLAAALYAALMLPVALRPPLREYVAQLLNALRGKFGRLVPVITP